MNGVERAQLQELSGVREIVSDLDAIRFKFGFSSVNVLTPRVEVNIRLGRIAQIPLKVEVIHDSINFIMILEFPMAYPREPLVITLRESASGSQVDTLRKDWLEDQLMLFSTSHIGNKGFVVELIDYLRRIQSEEHSFVAKNAEALTEEVISDTTSPRQPSSKECIVTSYKCRKCRAVLFVSSQIETHARLSRSSPPCGSIFLNEPTAWLQAAISADVAGKIHCPSCDSKVGTFNWSGCKCSCGAWIVPSIQFASGKIDQPPLSGISNVHTPAPVSEAVIVPPPPPPSFPSFE